MKETLPASALLLLFLFVLFQGEASPQEEGDQYVAVKAGCVITVSGEEIPNGTIVIRNGKIEAVGSKVKIPWGAKMIHAPHLTVMPGLVNPHSRFGLRQYSRQGSHPHLKVADEFFPESGDAYREILEAGYTTLGLYAEGRGLPGRTLAIVPFAKEGGAAALREDSYIRMTFQNPSSEKLQLKGAFEKARQEIEKVEKARKEWEEKKKKEEEEKKKAEAEKKKEEEGKKEPPKEEKKEPPKEDKKDLLEKEEKKGEEPKEFVPPPIDPASQPIVDLIQKKKGVRALVEMDSAEDFLHFKDALKEFEFEHDYLVLSLAGRSQGTDMPHVAEDMGKEKPLVLLYPMIIFVPYTQERIILPSLMREKGCTVAFLPYGDSAVDHRNVLEQLGELIGLGYPRAEGLKGITLYPARILGVDDRVGTIETGKDANLIFLSGDPFAVQTRIVKVMIDGEIVAEPAPVR